MREVKFRGKRIDTGEWIYGSLIQCDITGKRYILPMGSDANESDKVGHEGCLMLFTFEVIPETVGQYTGLKDKNGKEIFEGDIVFAIATYDCANIVFVWDDGGFVLVPCKYYKNYISRCGYKDIRFLDKEVVGNIHDNPELLEVV